MGCAYFFEDLQVGIVVGILYFFATFLFKKKLCVCLDIFFDSWLDNSAIRNKSFDKI